MQAEETVPLAAVAKFTGYFAGDSMQDALVFDSGYECNIQCDSSLLILSLLYILINQRSEVLNSPSQKLTNVPMKETTKMEFRLE